MIETTLATCQEGLQEANLHSGKQGAAWGCVPARVREGSGTGSAAGSGLGVGVGVPWLPSRAQAISLAAGKAS